ncbi:MAG: helix-turn-helix transcriptional regulator [Fuscovulum sp.]|nr:MAG: helix-turn-helix transcriptional regulator [Fuscovulum sp.]
MELTAQTEGPETEEPRGRWAASAPPDPHFGAYIRLCRETLKQNGEALSVRKLAGELGIEPAYLSKIERGVFAPPSEELIVKIARRLGEDPDRLLALGGKIASDLKDAIRARPELLSSLVRAVRDRPDAEVETLLREVRDGDW